MDSLQTIPDNSYSSALIDTFLKDHPEVKKALDMFGVAESHYLASLAATNPPRFYTASSTSPVEGGACDQLGRPAGPIR
jgi:hypothetical protein